MDKMEIMRLRRESREAELSRWKVATQTICDAVEEAVRDLSDRAGWAILACAEWDEWSLRVVYGDDPEKWRPSWSISTPEDRRVWICDRVERLSKGAADRIAELEAEVVHLKEKIELLEHFSGDKTRGEASDANV